MRPVTFDLDALRSFVAGVELGSFARAADRRGRSTSAISAQLKKLEEQAGQPVLRRQGRGLALTEAGEALLGYARRLLELNDEAVVALQDTALQGWVRLGLQEDFGEHMLPDVLGRFARAHPQVRIEARIARHQELLARVEAGQLDLALAWESGAASAHRQAQAAWPLRWIAAAERSSLPATASWSGEAPLPLVMLEAPCLLRTAATTALDRAGIPWRIAFTSASLGGVWAAVRAGLGITLRTPAGVPAGLALLPPGAGGLPTLPALGLGLHRAVAVPPPAVARLAEILQQRLQAAHAALVGDGRATAA
ncbi:MULTISPECIES: LysR substrate-binding domain-containing protein [Xanthomonas]|uniref:LysR substrate-binding domain-containing protein n=1 Tax=Xanthomonas rydalmerensis TaxID=3046274 RepID=A0ABZ0JQN0_9XANT|nr:MULTISPECIES: LysR substrate-binding domain-containing protein [unclassified Xanthomonas]MXV08049.1 LysR family transcriptional regulator [Xanthomonas sp. LMG 9002]WOS41313.1 LysR substrate-binding domain-containing protein [Xanthomonas sp. DM-2023]WOS45498.1 LysR substrate-binding domain-containing protein [Xanthomonas sp. DM-2023]WOS49677.1 LysR substrate-binding domain-containing protein [Xanthomonas sp. DM-2023]WOS53857.1 LysR substrate-binding domain-containing protein [Xanthomonas sp.